MGVVMEHDALGFHLCDAAIDVMLLHLEVGNAVAQEPAGLGELFVDVNAMPGAGELLRASHARRARADDGDRLAGQHRRRLRHQALRDGAVGDRAFDRFDGDGVLVDVERAGGFARRRADAAGDFGEIVGRVQVARGFVPIVAVDEVVPVRDLVVDRAARRAGAQASPCPGSTARRNSCSAPPGCAARLPAAAARIRANGECAPRPARSRGLRARTRETRLPCPLRALERDPIALKKSPLIPAKAGTQREPFEASVVHWVPAFAGTSG